ncbi:MAG: hypothetical protein EA412_06005 [Chitinophagaceae bacterium]|nr:MAG: hypothetical protein EA412_06005 [Chitinophagaceae bacterium]
MNLSTKVLSAFLTFSLLFLCGSHLEAQTPQGINYQAVARDADGNPITNSNIDVQFSLLSGSANGTLVWEETHSANSNSLGLFNLVIGDGTNTGGSAASFSDIDWSGDDHFLKVEVDFGSGFTEMGTTQFMSVPYALSAQSVVDMPVMELGELDDVNTSGASNGDVLQWDGNNWVPAAVSGGGGAPSGPAGGDLSGSYPDPVIADNAVTADKLDQMGASSGQVLQWDGSSWTPEDVPGSKWSEDGSDIYYDDGKVGIGTDEPYTTLHVENNEDMAGSTAGEVDGENAALTLVNPVNLGAGAMTGIRFNVSSVSNTGGAIAFERTGGQSQGRLHFATKSSNAVSNEIPIRMTISQDGNVGIGTTSPNTLLEIANPSGSDTVGLHMLGSDNYIRLNSWRIGDLGSGGIGPGSFGGDMAITRNNVPHYTFWMSYFRPMPDNTVALGGLSNRWTSVFASNGTINTSDMREKTNIQNSTYGLSEVMQMRAVNFEWIDRPQDGTKIGFIAQELLDIVPEVVVTKEKVENRETGEVTYVEAENYGVYYSDLLPVFSRAIQEQQAIIEAQKEELDKIKQVLKEAGYSID